MTTSRTPRALLLLLGGVAALAAATPAVAQEDEHALSEPARPAEGASGSGSEATPNPNNNIQSDNDEPVDSDPEPEVSSPPPPAPVTAEADAPDDAQAAVAEAADEAGDAEADEADAAPAHRGPALSFANSFFSYTNAVTLHTFAPAAQLSYDPTWLMNFSLTPRFYLTDTTFLWLNQGMSVELTDSNTGTYNREPLLTGTLLDLRQLLSVEGFVFQGQLRLAAPTSKASQAAGRVLQTGSGSPWRGPSRSSRASPWPRPSATGGGGRRATCRRRATPTPATAHSPSRGSRPCAPRRAGRRAPATSCSAASR